MSICADILQNIENDPNFLENRIICVESRFFKSTQKVSANPCTGRAPVHQGKRKHGRANPNLKQWWLFFFLTSEGLFTWTGCLKVRPLPRSTTRRFWQTLMNGWEEDLKCGRTAHGLFTKTKRRHIKPCCQDVFDEEHPPYSPDLAPCDFYFISKEQVCVKRNVSST